MKATQDKNEFDAGSEVQSDGNRKNPIINQSNDAQVSPANNFNKLLGANDSNE